MDLSLNETQQQIVDSLDRIMERAGGYHHTLEVLNGEGFDHVLFKEIADAGFFGLAAEGLTLLEATLVAERLARLGAYVAGGATAIVYPAVTGESAPGPIALASATPDKPFRCAVQAAAILIDDGGDEARLLVPEPGDVTRVNNDRAGWPLGKLSAAAIARAKPLGAGTGDRLRTAWQIAIAAEASGAMRGAVATTARYLTERVQFGRPLATFQALQHRLAHMSVQSEGAYWVTLAASATPDDPLAAATAATQAIQAAPVVFRECQQMHGAMGFTREYPLHIWTMQLSALQREQGGVMGVARTVARLLAAAPPSERRVALQ